MKTIQEKDQEILNLNSQLTKITSYEILESTYNSIKSAPSTQSITHSMTGLNINKEKKEDKDTILKSLFMEPLTTDTDICEAYKNQANLRFDFHVFTDFTRCQKIFRSNFCNNLNERPQDSKKHLLSCRNFSVFRIVHIDHTFDLEKYKSDKTDLEKRIQFLERQGFLRENLIDPPSDDSNSCSDSDFDLPKGKNKGKKKKKKGKKRGTQKPSTKSED